MGLIPANGIVAQAFNNEAPGQAANVAAAAALTYVALTDSGGGTADGTVASGAAPTTLTDSSGYDGTHGDTVAAMAAITTLTDSSGLSGSHNDTVASMSPITTLTAVANVDGASPNNEIQDTSATVTQAEARVFLKTFKDKFVLLFAAEVIHAQNISDVTQKVIELVAREIIAAQNISNITQKMIEMVTLATTSRDNLKEVTTVIAQLGVDIAEVRTQMNAEIAALKTANLQRTS